MSVHDGFSDEDLNRLKEELWNGPPNGKMLDLLARLDASEKAYLLYRNDPETRHTPEQVEAGLVWRKSKGESL